ncbi:LAFA_0D14004g1_1 [Lachancea sp. 'fantastica']|nr:LAFA_0D14004g1_1 [Lachancea sp. 'fantastica']
MMKSAASVFQLDCPAKSTITPIRQSGQGFFDSSDESSKNSLGKDGISHTCVNPYSRSIWSTEHDFRANAEQVAKLKSKVQHTSKSSSVDLLKKEGCAVSPTEPLNLKTNNDSRLPMNDAKLFLDSLFDLLANEEQYAHVTDALNMIYRWELHNNKKFKNKLLAQDSQDEILLFGNIDTITQLSKILVKSVKNYVFASCKAGSGMQDWERHGTHLSVPLEFRENFDPIEFFDSHLNKIKSTYCAYFSSHHRQTQLLIELKTKQRSLFYKWYEICLKKSDYLCIEDILDAPIHHVTRFLEDLRRMTTYAENFLAPETVQGLNSLIVRYSKFVADSLALLTPELASSQRAPSLPPEIQSESHLTVPVSENSCRSSDTHFSMSSSRYSEHTNMDAFHELPSAEEEDNLSNTHSDNPTLAECIERFKRVEGLLGKLDKELVHLDLTAIVDKNLRQAENWRSIFEFEPVSSLLSVDENVESIYTAYVNKIHQQRQEVMLLKLTELQKHVLEPLQQMREMCERVSIQVGNFKVLKKDYLASLMAKNKRDIKSQVLVRHFEQLQAQLLNELPSFLQILFKMLDMLLLGYNKCMLHYMETLCGGKRLLNRELMLLESGERESGDNFDILQMFSTSRFYVKQLIRENWNCHGRAMESRVVRKLFEL